MFSSKPIHRRAFLNFLAASPILASAGFDSRWVEDFMAAQAAAQGAPGDQARNDVVIKSVKEALNVFDFDAVARTKLNVAHYTFITDGSFNNETVRANREGFTKYQVRLRRLSGITHVDQSVSLFGKSWESPIYFCPVGRMNAYYPDGAEVVARAAKATSTLQMLSASPTVLLSPKGIENVIAARGEPVWVSATGEAMQPDVIKRIEATGCPALVWTVDDGGANTIGAKSIQRAGVADLDREADSRCTGCHSNLPKITRIREATTPMEEMGADGLAAKRRKIA